VEHIEPLCETILISAPPAHISAHSSCPVLSRLFVESPPRDGVLGHKLWFLHHPGPDRDFVYLAVGSGNLTARDWRMTESFWGVELPLSTAGETVGGGGMMWREAVGSLLRSAGFPQELWGELVERLIDWSAIPDHILPVWSEPGKVHSEALKSFSQPYTGVQIQVSNIGAIGLDWLESFLFPAVLHLDAQRFIGPENTELVYPSHGSMMTCDPEDRFYVYQNAKDGALSLMVDTATDGLIHHAKIFEALGRWVMIGSHNLSIAAWGTEQRGPRNYELSVVFGGCTLKHRPYPAFGEAHSVTDPW
jgi:hypothetical protein